MGRNLPANPELLPGTLYLLILRALRAGPLHGYAIAKRSPRDLAYHGQTESNPTCLICREIGKVPPSTQMDVSALNQARATQGVYCLH